MKQIEIEYFFPLTEQTQLDLDFSQCSPHQYWIRAKGIAGLHGPHPTGMVYKFAEPVEPSFCIDIDQTPITVLSKNKPSAIKKYIYKMLGIKWKLK
jgi:hypothetical protein